MVMKTLLQMNNDKKERMRGRLQLDIRVDNGED